jgi:hypothetical protein
MNKLATIVSLVVLTLYLGYGCVGFWRVVDKGMLPCWTDEFLYQADTRYFIDNVSLVSGMTINESYSPIGEFGVHSFAYTLYDGIFATLFTSSISNAIVYANLFAVLLGIVIIFSLPRITITDKSIWSALIISSYTALFYGFTYMQESIQIPIAVVASYLIYRIYAEERRTQKWIFLYVVLILIASLFRINWVVWLIAFLPLMRDIGRKVAFLFVFSMVIFLAFLVMRLIYAPYPLGFLASLVTTFTESGLIKAIELIASNFTYNIKSYLSPLHDPDWFYTYSKYVLLVILVLFYSWAGKRIKRSYDALFSIILVNIFLIFLVYDAWDYREIRTLAPLLVASFGMILFHKKYTVAFIFLAVQCMFATVLYDYVEKNIEQRIAQKVAYEESVKLRVAFAEIAQKVTGTDKITVLLSGSFTGDYKLYQLCLPFISFNNIPIRYSINYRDGLEVNPEKLDYVISQVMLRDNKDHLLVHKTPFYYLYKVNRYATHIQTFKEY